MPAHTAQNFQPAEPGQHDVENDQSVSAREDALDASLTVVHGIQLEPLGLEIFGEQFGQASIVVNSQDALHKKGSL